MTAAREAVEEIMRSEHADVLRESVAWAVREIMESEVATQIGAELGERGPEARSTQRNGYSAQIDGPDAHAQQIGPLITADFPDTIASLIALAKERTP